MPGLMKSDLNDRNRLDESADQANLFKFRQPNLGFSLENLADCFKVPSEDVWKVIHARLSGREASSPQATVEPLPIRPLRLVKSRTAHPRAKGRGNRVDNRTA